MTRQPILPLLLLAFLAGGCASVPMASVEESGSRKAFAPPPADKAALYIFRDSSLGGSLKKTLYVNGEVIGESAPKTFFYRQVTPGTTTISTESEFSENDLSVETRGGQNYFIRQYIRIGVFVGGANLELVGEEEGREGVRACELAQERAVVE